MTVDQEAEGDHTYMIGYIKHKHTSNHTSTMSNGHQNAKDDTRTSLNGLFLFDASSRRQQWRNHASPCFHLLDTGTLISFTIGMAQVCR
jgi:hypothetical protein